MEIEWVYEERMGFEGLDLVGEEMERKGLIGDFEEKERFLMILGGFREKMEVECTNSFLDFRKKIRLR